MYVEITLDCEIPKRRTMPKQCYTKIRSPTSAVERIRPKWTCDKLGWLVFRLTTGERVKLKALIKKAPGV